MDTQGHNDLGALLQQKKEWLERMLDITRRFGALLLADKIDEFADGLKSREAIIARIDAITRMERQLEPGDGADTEKLKKQTQELIRDILRIDADNAALAKEKVKRYREQIKSINDSKKGLGNYAKAPGNDDAFYVDAKK